MADKYIFRTTDYTKIKYEKGMWNGFTVELNGIPQDMSQERWGEYLMQLLGSLKVQKDFIKQTYYLSIDESDRRLDIITSENRDKVHFKDENKVQLMAADGSDSDDDEEEEVEDADAETLDVNTEDSDAETADDENAEPENSIRAEIRNVVGIIRVPDFRFKNKRMNSDVILQIGSRFDTAGNYYLLQTMLLHAKRMEITGASVPASQDSVFHFMYIYLFCKQFMKAFEEGPYRTYVRFEKNDSHLRGTIDIARHIRLNAGMDNGKVAYSYRELTEDNSINHLILHTYYYAKKLYPTVVARMAPEVEDTIHKLELMTESFGKTSIAGTMAKCNRVIAHPYYYKYEELRKTCLNFLQYMGLSFFDGEEDNEVQGILFYAPDLWEEYLESCFSGYNMELKAQFDVPVCIDINEALAPAAQGATHAYPDYVFFKESKPYMVLDAKYRIVWSRGGFDLPDFTKCIRDMNATATHKTGVIFPVKEGSKNQAMREEYISYYNPDDRFYRIPVIIPKIENGVGYAEWSDALKKNMDIAAESIKGIMV